MLVNVHMHIHSCLNTCIMKHDEYMWNEIICQKLNSTSFALFPVLLHLQKPYWFLMTSALLFFPLYMRSSVDHG